MKHRISLAAVALALAAPAAAAPDRAAVVSAYADIAHAAYEDSWQAAKRLQTRVEALLARPSAAALEAARAAWLAARVPYQQTEVFRFGNAIVDDWEGRVNAWPLDEGLIDYVDASYGAADGNALAAINVVANRRFTLSGRRIDAGAITPELLEETLHEADGIEANVATGYHAVEFLLWGQDLHGHDAGAGGRAWTDYARGNACTHGHCARRAAYLEAATELLVRDLAWMTRQWAKDGAARAALRDETRGLAAILTGMGSLSYGELAGERMRLGLLLHDPEEEHDCFSDNTHNSHYYDALGVRNIYLGEYVRTDGSRVGGPSVSDLVAASDKALDAEMRARLDATMHALGRVKTAAEGGFFYDMMLREGSETGAALLADAIEQLVVQTRAIGRVAQALGVGALEFEGSDSLDNPDAVFQ